MAATEPPVPYRLVYSDAVKQRLREMFDEAFARGDGPALTTALKEFDSRLRIFPQFGDPQINLTGEPGVVYQGIIRPLSMRYGVLEDRQLVLVGALPVLLPMDGPEAAGE